MSDELNPEIPAAALLDEAIAALQEVGRYWFDASRPVPTTLHRLLTERGYDVIILSLPPDWEYVISTKSDYTPDLVEWLAQTRSDERVKSIPELELPR